MSLPLQAVDRLFTRLTATYGRQFLGLYDGLDANAIKTVWAHELSGFMNRLPDVAWALENLPERAPNAIEFRNLCRKAPRTEAQPLPEPPADPGRIRAEFEKLKPLIEAAKAVRSNANLDWARRIVEKKDAGLNVNALPLRMAQEALARRGVVA